MQTIFAIVQITDFRIRYCRDFGNSPLRRGIGPECQSSGMSDGTYIFVDKGIVRIASGRWLMSAMDRCVKDKNNQIIEGNSDTIKTVNDIWSFSKNMWSQNPTWYLVGTSNK